MRLYLDDDSVSGLLIRLLSNVGHDVEIPADAGLAGEDDPVHLTYAVEEDRVFLSGNHNDFRKLHNLLASNTPIENQFIILNHWR